jgi:hypothetical protein
VGSRKQTHSVLSAALLLHITSWANDHSRRLVGGETLMHDSSLYKMLAAAPVWWHCHLI